MNTIKLGSVGADVLTLQRLLGITADGKFGLKTHDAVVDYQKSHGLIADGIVGEKTWALLIEPIEKKVPGCVYLPIDVHITASKNREIKYIVVHYTAGKSSLAGAARANRKVFLSRKASADFVVDRTEAIQVNPDLRNYCCWSVGDGKGHYGISNKNSVSIEMCSDLVEGTTDNANHKGWQLNEAVLERTLGLIHVLMKRLNIPKDRVVRHYDASRKNCPGIIGWNDGKMMDTTIKSKSIGQNNSSEWLKFKERI